MPQLHTPDVLEEETRFKLALLCKPCLADTVRVEHCVPHQEPEADGHPHLCRHVLQKVPQAPTRVDLECAPLARQPNHRHREAARHGHWRAAQAGFPLSPTLQNLASLRWRKWREPRQIYWRCRLLQLLGLLGVMLR
jgi:hypothetical protein